jgi:hypothetical protein
MKPLILCSLIFTTSFFFSQEIQSISLSKEIKETDFYPQIEGVFEGRISIGTLGSPNGITTKIGWEIKSFEVSFFSGRDYETFHINSHVLPDSIMKKIISSSKGLQLFLTKIEAFDRTNTRHILNNMTLIPFKNED